jgi:hypothetical protein
VEGEEEEEEEEVEEEEVEEDGEAGEGEEGGKEEGEEEGEGEREIKLARVCWKDSALLWELGKRYLSANRCAAL